MVSPGGRGRRQICVSVFAALALLSIEVLQAAVTGSVSGTITDATGGVIPSASVAITNTAQGVKTTTTTDARGVYTFPSLPVGIYNLVVDAAGFKSRSRDGITVDLDSVQDFSFALEVQERTEELTVTENSAHVETESTQVGQVVTTRQMTAIALNGRSYTDLLALQPGIVPLSTQLPDSVVMAG